MKKSGKTVEADNNTIADQSPTPESQGAHYPAAALLDNWTNHDWTDGIQINHMQDLESLVVKTENSTYEITILCSRTGQVMVRGGHYFPHFTRARLAGCSLGGSFLKMLGVYIGFRMELCQEVGPPIITSPVRSIALNVTPTPTA